MKVLIQSEAPITKVLEDEFLVCARQEQNKHMDRLRDVANQARESCTFYEGGLFRVFMVLLAGFGLIALGFIYPATAAHLFTLTGAVMLLRAVLQLRRRRFAMLTLDAEGVRIGRQHTILLPWQTILSYNVALSGFLFFNHSLEIRLHLIPSFTPEPFTDGCRTRYRASSHEIIFRTLGLRKMTPESFIHCFERYWQASEARRALENLASQETSSASI